MRLLRALEDTWPLPVQTGGDAGLHDESTRQAGNARRINALDAPHAGPRTICRAMNSVTTARSSEKRFLDLRPSFKKPNLVTGEHPVSTIDINVFRTTVDAAVVPPTGML